MEYVTLTLNLNELASLIRELSPADVRAISERNPPKPQPWGIAPHAPAPAPAPAPVMPAPILPDYKRYYEEYVICIADLLGISRLSEPNKLLDEIKFLKLAVNSPRNIHNGISHEQAAATVGAYKVDYEWRFTNIQLADFERLCTKENRNAQIEAVRAKHKAESALLTVDAERKALAAERDKLNDKLDARDRTVAEIKELIGNFKSDTFLMPDVSRKFLDNLLKLLDK